MCTSSHLCANCNCMNSPRPWVRHSCKNRSTIVKLIRVFTTFSRGDTNAKNPGLATSAEPGAIKETSGMHIHPWHGVARSDATSTRAKFPTRIPRATSGHTRQMRTGASVKMNQMMAFIVSVHITFYARSRSN